MTENERFENLLQNLLDDDMTAEQLEELVDFANSDPSLLNRVQDHLVISDLLSQYEKLQRSEDRFMDAVQQRLQTDGDSKPFVDQVISSIKSETFSESIEHRSGQHDRHFRFMKRHAVAMVVTAAIAIFIVTLVWESDSSTEVADDSIRHIEGVAVLTRITHPTDELEAGSTIPAGLLRCDEGLMQLEFFSGATVVVEAPAEIEILDDFRVHCRAGRLRAHVPEVARGFAVLAAAFELVDLGTEFGIEVSDSGSAEVHVFDGKVELYDVESNRDTVTRKELNAGDALAIDRNGSSTPIAVRNQDFVTPSRLDHLASQQRRKRLFDWSEYRDSLKNDPRVVAYFPFDRNDSNDRLLTGFGADDSVIEGAIVGCEWAEGRWPEKTSLQFKRPGDRVRVNIPGEFQSITYSTWLRVDGLDRRITSLLLSDGFDTNALHWQIKQPGFLSLGVNRSPTRNKNYSTDQIFDAFRLGQWVHLTMVYDSSRSQVLHYVNGRLFEREKMRATESGVVEIGNATIGNWCIPSADREKWRGSTRIRNLNGRMDELIVFGEALDEQEVRQIYEVGRP